MRSPIIILAIVILLGLVVGFKADAANPQASRSISLLAVAVPGTHVSISKPEGFIEASNFSGFINNKNNASLMVTELPGPYAKVASGFNDAGLKSRGMNCITKQDLTVDGFPGILLQVTQAAYGTVFRKWVLCFGDERETVLVTATCPDQFTEELGNVLKDAILSTKWDKNRKILGPLSDLTFEVAAPTGLKFAHRLQNTLLYTKTGEFGDQSKSSTMFIVGQAIAQLDIADHQAFARQRLLKTAHLCNIKIEKDMPVTVSGLAGREIYAQASDSKSNKPMFFYQVILFGNKTYYLMQGMTEAENRSAYEKIFKTMAYSFKTKS